MHPLSSPPTVAEINQAPHFGGIILFSQKNLAEKTTGLYPSKGGHRPGLIGRKCEVAVSSLGFS